MAQSGRARLVLLATASLYLLVIVTCQNPIEMKIISDLLATESKLFSNRYGRSYQFNVTDLDGSGSSHSLKVGSSKSQGEYKILLPDNRWQIVSYVADEKGYRATVRYETVDHTPISEETQGGSESYWAGSTVGTPSPPQRIPGPALPPRITSKTPTYYLKPEAPKRDHYPLVSQVNTYVIHPAPDESKEWRPEPVRSTYYPPAPTLRPSPRDPYVPRRPEGPPIVPIKRPPATIATYRPRPHVGYQVPVDLSGLPAPRTTTTAKPDEGDEIEANMRFNPNQYHPFWEPQAEKPDVPVLPLRPVQRPVAETKRPTIPPEHRPPPPTPPRPEPTIKPHTGYKPAHSGYPKPHSGYTSEEDDTTTKRPVYAGSLKLRPSYQVTENYQQTYDEPTTYKPPSSQFKLQPTTRPDYHQPPAVYDDPPTAVYQTTPKYTPAKPPSYDQHEYYRPHTEPPTAVYQTTSKYAPTEPPSYEQPEYYHSHAEPPAAVYQTTTSKYAPKEPPSYEQPNYYRPQTEPPSAVYQTTSKYVPNEPPSYEQAEYYDPPTAVYRPTSKYTPQNPPSYEQPEYYRPPTEPPTAVYQITPKYAAYHARPTPGYPETTTKWSQPVAEESEKPYAKPDYYREPLRVKPDPYAFDPFDESFKPTEGPYGNFRPTLGPYGNNYRPEPPREPQDYYQPPAYEQQYEAPSYEIQPAGGYDEPPASPAVASLPGKVVPVTEEPIPVFDDSRPPKGSFDGPLFYQPSFARGRTSTTTTTTTPAPPVDFEEPSLLLSKFKFRPKSKTTTSDGFGTRTQPLKRTKGQSTSGETIVYDWQDPSAYLPSAEANKHDIDDPYKYSDHHYGSAPEEVTTKRARKKKIKVKTTTTTEQPVEHSLESYYEEPHDSPFETSHKIPYDGTSYEVPYEVVPYDSGPAHGPIYPDAEPSIEPVDQLAVYREPSTELPFIEQSTEPPTTAVPTTIRTTTTTTAVATTEAETTTTSSTMPAPATTTKRKRKKKKGLRSKGSRKSKLRSKPVDSESTSTELASSESTDSTSTTWTSTTTTTPSSTTTTGTSTKRPTRIRFPPRIKYVAKSDRFVRQHNSKEDDLLSDAAELTSSSLTRRNDDDSHVVTGQFDIDATLNSIPIDRLAMVDLDEAAAADDGDGVDEDEDDEDDAE